MITINGSCHCENLSVQLVLSRASETYAPRSCDCDFCRERGAAYVSDPEGSLRLRIRSERACERYRQGDGMAECLICTGCGVYVAALYAEAGGSLYGTVNVRVLSRTLGFAPWQSVSPKRLSAEDKVKRWKQLWFSDVTVER
jgi:hypothetical protein